MHSQDSGIKKINIQKSIVFLYTIMRLLKEITKTILFSIASKIEINLTKEMKYFYNKNYKTLREKVKTPEDKETYIYGLIEIIL